MNVMNNFNDMRKCFHNIKRKKVEYKIAYIV